MALLANPLLINLLPILLLINALPISLLLNLLLINALPISLLPNLLLINALPSNLLLNLLLINALPISRLLINRRLMILSFPSFSSLLTLRAVRPHDEPLSRTFLGEPQRAI